MRRQLEEATTQSHNLEEKIKALRLSEAEEVNQGMQDSIQMGEVEAVGRSDAGEAVDSSEAEGTTGRSEAGETEEATTESIRHTAKAATIERLEEEIAIQEVAEADPETMA